MPHDSATLRKASGTAGPIHRPTGLGVVDVGTAGPVVAAGAVFVGLTEVEQPTIMTVKSKEKQVFFIGA